MPTIQMEVSYQLEVYKKGRWDKQGEEHASPRPVTSAYWKARETYEFGEVRIVRTRLTRDTLDIE